MVKPVEIQIPVPWGIIAGKSWGDPKNPTIVAFHGFQDNANSFDRLIPLLPNTFRYVCVDLPCHGKSSHFATKSIITSFDFILAVKLVLDHYKRKNYILIGHSFGGQIVTFFAQIYPEYVAKLISLDAYYLWPVPANQILRNFRDLIGRYEKLHDLSAATAPIYTFDEALQRMMAARVVPISENGARVLLSRSLIPVESENKFKMSTSQQLKYYLRAPFSTEYQVEILREHPLRCPFLLIGASAKTSRLFRSYVVPVLKEFEKNPNYSFEMVEGSHDVHIDHPERVAPLITKFLLTFQNKL